MTTPAGTRQLRSFGLLVGGIFALIALWPVVVRGEDLRVWAIVVAIFLAAPALVLPASLGPVYRVWMGIGYVLAWINTRIILSIIFYGLFTPLGLLRRVILGSDALQRTFDVNASTYRTIRQARARGHLKNQF